jgi:hypothetical protein
MGIIAWFKALDWFGKGGIIVAVAMCALVAVKTAEHFVDAAFTAAADKGGATVRADVAEKGMEDVAKANDAAESVKRDPVVRDDVCVRTSRTPENC